jgi:hypothetical protein
MIFYSGVVENRLDPLKLGRCQVRIVGLHTEDKKILPTDSLPWAYPLQPVTSAAMNGIGHSPVGPVEGTWVILFFRDEEKQQPVILGTIGGIPQNKEINTNYLRDDDTVLINTETGTELRTLQGVPVVDKDGNPVYAGDSSPVQSGSGGTVVTNAATTPTANEFIGALTKDDIEKYKIAIARLESASEPGSSSNFTIEGTVGDQNYGVVNAYGRLGKYQLTGYSLAVTGYVSYVLSASSERVFPSNFKLADDTIWSGKLGLVSATSFLAAADAQETVMDEYTRFNYVELKRLGIIKDNTNPKEILGYLSVAHPDGVRRVQSLVKNSDSQDGYGNTSTDLYQLGYASLEGDKPETLPQNVPPGAEASTVPLGDTNPDGTISTGVKTDAGVVFGFKDPNLKYPLKEFLNEPDTNRLTRSEFVDKTAVGLKDSTRELKVPVAISNATWNQPESPYNAIYPFNHVYQSESGHLQEFDDTPQNERIHLFHKKGSFTEIDCNGTEVHKIVGDSYEIIDRNGYLYVKGAHNVTVDGVTNIFCRSDANVEIIGDTKIYCRNDVDMEVSGKMDLSVAETLNIRCKDLNVRVLNDANMTVNNILKLRSVSDMHITTASNMFLTTSGNMDITAKANYTMTAFQAANLSSSSNFNISTTGEVATMNFNSRKDINLYSVYGIYLFAKNRIEQRAELIFRIKCFSGSLDIEGRTLFLNSGKIATAPPIALLAEPPFLALEPLFEDIDDAGARLTPINSFFESLSTPNRKLSNSSYYETPDDGNPEKFIQQQQNSGVINPNEKPNEVEKTEQQQKPPPDGKPVSCAGFENMTEFPVSSKLSANFYLGDFVPGGGTGYICVASSPHKLQDQAGLTKAQIVCNLKGLAENVLENLIKIIPKSDIFITSGYRQLGLVGAESKTSQHPKGMACDIVLKKTPKDRKKHYDLIQEIREKVPHDQLILEYLSNGSVWIHVSYNASGSQRKQAFTMSDHKTIGTTGTFTLVV